MADRKADQDAYAAGQLGDHVRGDLDGKPPEVLYSHTGYVEDEDTRTLLDWLAAEELASDGLYQLALSKHATATTTEAIRGGNVSQMQYPVGIVRQTGSGEDALSTMARRLAAEGAIYLVLGPPGSGKTALMLDVAPVWRALTGGAVVTNVTSWPRADRYVETDHEMKAAMGEIEGQVLAVLDEGSQTLTSRGTDAPKADQFAKSMKYVRKAEDGGQAKQGSVLLAGHTRADLAKEFRRLCSGAFEKVSRADPGRVRLLDSEGGRDRFEAVREFEGLTDTAEEFDEHESSSFRVVGDEEPEDDGPTADEAAEQARRDAWIETALRAVQPWDEGEGMSYRDAAQFVPKSKSWVGERAREWEDGRYRDLVDVPSA